MKIKKLFAAIISLSLLLTITPAVSAQVKVQPQVKVSSSNKTWNEVAHLFREQQEQPNLKSNDVVALSDDLIRNFSLTGARTDNSPVGALHIQFQTNAEHHKTVLWADDYVLFSGSSRAFWDTDYPRTPITLSRSDSFGISYLGTSATFSAGLPPVGVSISTGSNAITFTYEKTDKNYQDAYYKEVRGKAYSIQAVNQSSSASVVFGVSTIATSAYDSKYTL